MNAYTEEGSVNSTVAIAIADMTMDLIAGLERLAQGIEQDLTTQEGRDYTRQVVLDSLSTLLPHGREAFETDEEFETAAYEVSTIVCAIANIVTAIEWSN